jgi:biopolymer transport protein ExbB/TolQ
MGGPLFMGILSFLLLIVIIFAISIFIKMYSEKELEDNKLRQQLSYIKSVGLFAAITGILGQLIGLYSAFVAIESAGDVAPAMVFGGLKVSMITTLYGIVIYLFSLLLWFIMSNLLDKRS